MKPVIVQNNSLKDQLYSKILTTRRVQYMNFLHHGALTFDTLVYDTNVGDIRFSSHNVLKT